MVYRAGDEVVAGVRRAPQVVASARRFQAASAPPRSAAQPTNFANRDPGATSVSFRSGPAETQSTSTPAASSISNPDAYRSFPRPAFQAASAPPRSAAQPTNFANRDPGTTSVSFRSGPVETQPTSMPVASSRNFK